MASVATCFHESGHCIALLALDHEVESAYAREAGLTLPRFPDRISSLHRAVVVLAGPVAEYELHAGQPLHIQSDDTQRLNDALQQIPGNRATNERDALELARKIVTKRSAALSDVAEHLRKANATWRNPVSGDAIAWAAHGRWGWRKPKALRRQRREWKRHLAGKASRSTPT